jgi:(p)ppGpp synthase/HD superfamily hydrolase
MVSKKIDNGLRHTFDTIYNKLLENTIVAQLSFRLKSPLSILKKMMRKKADVRELKDVIACRVVVPKVEDCYKVLKVVNTSFVTIPEKFKNYILKPKKNGYQGLHAVIVVNSSKRDIELQIRTQEMHDIAESGKANHLEYKHQQEGIIEPELTPMLDEVIVNKALSIWKNYDWTESRLLAYEQEIKNIWRRSVGCNK